MSDRAEEIQEVAVRALRKSLERRLGDKSGVIDATALLLCRPSDDLPVDVRAECAKHGPTSIVGAAGRAFCVKCLQLARAGRGAEVLTTDDGGAISMPGIVIYPKQPINFISITATITKGATDG